MAKHGSQKGGQFLSAREGRVQAPPLTHVALSPPDFDPASGREDAPPLGQRRLPVVLRPSTG